VAGTNVNTELGDLDDNTGFDQFKNRNTTYNESQYTTDYDITKLSKQQIDRAIKIDKEISSKDSKGNMHLAMERGQYIPSADMNQNEEVAFSGVKRRAIKNQKKFKAINSKLG